MVKKPIGDAGPLHIQGGAPPTVSCQKIKFPEKKEDQEKFIAETFVRQHAAGANYALKQLPQDDFYFNLEIGGNSSYLELMEMMFPGKKRGPPYADNEQKVQSNLLLYFTHWRLQRPSGLSSQIHRQGLGEEPHGHPVAVRSTNRRCRVEHFGGGRGCVRAASICRASAAAEIPSSLSSSARCSCFHNRVPPRNNGRG
jgi:hypothetical protein